MENLPIIDRDAGVKGRFEPYDTRRQELTMEDRDYLIGRAILELTHAIRKKNNACLKAVGLTGVQTKSLLYLVDSKRKDLTINGLKEYLGISHQATQGIAKRMADKGVITLEKSPRDGREKIIAPTEKGVRLRQQLGGSAVGIGEYILSGISEEEKKIFYEILLKALSNVEQRDRL